MWFESAFNLTRGARCARRKFPHNECMPSSHVRSWPPLALTFVSALLVGASAVYWVLGIQSIASPQVQVAPLAAAPDAPQSKDLVRAMGGKPLVPASAPPALSTQFQLVGVVAGPVGKGYALLAAGSAAPKAYTVGSALADGLVLQSVSARGARIGPSMQGPSSLELTLPKPHGW